MGNIKVYNICNLQDNNNIETNSLKQGFGVFKINEFTYEEFQQQPMP